jgi:HK97 gp10 family phage protein
MDLEYRINGSKETAQVLKMLPGAIRKRVLNTATRAAAREMKKEAERNAPKSGINRQVKFAKNKKYFQKPLHEQIKVTTTQKGQYFTTVSVHIGSAFWGRFKEFGTSKMPAEPWFRPAFDNSQQMQLRKLQASMVRGITRESKKLAAPLLKKGK